MWPTAPFKAECGPQPHSPVKKHLAVFCVRHTEAPIAPPAPFWWVGYGRAAASLVALPSVHMAARFEDAVSRLSWPASTISQHEFLLEEGSVEPLTPVTGRHETPSNKPTTLPQEHALLDAPGMAGSGFQLTASANAPSKGCAAKQQKGGALAHHAQ